MPTPSLKSTLTAIIGTIALTGATALTTIPAHAGTTDTVSVSIDRAELLSDEGMRRAYYRIKHAAETACQANEGPQPITQRVAADACADAMIESLVQQLKSKKMVAFHAQEKTKAG